MISIRAPLAGSDIGHSGPFLPLLISIRAPLAGSDGAPIGGDGPEHDFNPRSPCGERRIAGGIASAAAQFQSALPLRGATYASQVVYLIKICISIRAPLAGSDFCRPRANTRVSPFQSALPLRGATDNVVRSRVHRAISIRAPLAGSDWSHALRLSYGGVISIRAPLAGSDTSGVLTYWRGRIFQSALPLRGATAKYERAGIADHISIRAPLAGSDRYIL